MARKLTRKQRVFVDRKADGATGVAAVMGNYNVKDYDTAKSIASENLTKPYILDELKKLGFDSSNAKRVVAQILNDDEAKHQDRLKAASEVFDVMGDYAPVKSINLNVITEVSPELREIADRLRNAD